MWETTLEETNGEYGVPKICGVLIEKGPWKGKLCPCEAGVKTVHLGYGPCWTHAGAKLRGRAEGAWLAAHKFAQELNVTPWDGLLMAVRIAAGKVAYCEWILSQAVHDRELEGRVTHSDDGLMIDPDTREPLGVGQFRDRTFWVVKSELWQDRLARHSKMAIDAGVAERLVEAQQLDIARIARVLNAALEECAEDEELQTRMRARLRKELLQIEVEDLGRPVIEGETVVAE